jgi:hypothetical protein
MTAAAVLVGVDPGQIAGWAVAVAAAVASIITAQRSGRAQEVAARAQDKAAGVDAVAASQSALLGSLEWLESRVDVLQTQVVGLQADNEVIKRREWVCRRDVRLLVSEVRRLGGNPDNLPLETPA